MTSLSHVYISTEYEHLVIQVYMRTVCLLHFIAVYPSKWIPKMFIFLLIKFAKSKLQIVKTVFFFNKIFMPNISRHPSFVFCQTQISLYQKNCKVIPLVFWAGLKSYPSAFIHHLHVMKYVSELLVNCSFMSKIATRNKETFLFTLLYLCTSSFLCLGCFNTDSSLRSAIQ